jgi:TRAP-type mannitol/chloroaromatic compound transport system permease large subunit
VLQTSYLTPPFGYAIFYLQGAVSGLNLSEVYRGVVPFVGLQLLCVALIWIWPELALWLPSKLN